MARSMVGGCKMQIPNPYPTKEATEDAEVRLANDLRKRGFAAWAGHHDVD